MSKEDFEKAMKIVAMLKEKNNEQRFSYTNWNHKKDRKKNGWMLYFNVTIYTSNDVILSNKDTNLCLYFFLQYI